MPDLWARPEVAFEHTAANPSNSWLSCMTARPSSTQPVHIIYLATLYYRIVWTARIATLRPWSMIQVWTLSPRQNNASKPNVFLASRPTVGQPSFFFLPIIYSGTGKNNAAMLNT